jgi:hypothetical protein
MHIACMQMVGTETGLTADKVAAKLTMIATDGAAVMAGSKSGVQARMMQDHAPHAQGIHCTAHRVNLVAIAVDNAWIVTVLVDGCDRVRPALSRPFRVLLACALFLQCWHIDKASCAYYIQQVLCRCTTSSSGISLSLG